MIYELANRVDRDKAITRFKNLLDNDKRIELTVKHPKRTIRQNAYLHLILSAFGLNFGYTLEETKQYIFKKEVNPEIFYEGEKEGLVKMEKWRSTAELDTGELTNAIDRFLDYSAKNGYRLPEPEDMVWIAELEKEVHNNSKHL